METFIRDVFQTRYREATASAILFAIVIGVVMNAAITYAGLKIGFTIGGSAILGTAFIIPLRKQMIEIDRLRFPSGTAVAAILTGRRGAAAARHPAGRAGGDCRCRPRAPARSANARGRCRPDGRHHPPRRPRAGRAGAAGGDKAGTRS